MPEIEKVALFDMDGTLCDYRKGLLTRAQEMLPSGYDAEELFDRKETPSYFQTIIDTIRSREEWWATLPRFELGWDVLEIARSLEYKIMILTQGPRRNPATWAGKKKWIDEHLGKECDITITRDKGSVYGTILVDDFPEYVQRWLEWRPRGRVIMPANKENESYKHPQVIRYNKENLEQVREIMKEARERDTHPVIR